MGYYPAGIKDYKAGCHTLWYCTLHLVWVTKYRYPVLSGDVGERVRELLRGVSRAPEMRIYAGSVNRDHVQMPTAAPTHLSVSRAVQYLKVKSLHKLLSENAVMRKR